MMAQLQEMKFLNNKKKEDKPVSNVIKINRSCKLGRQFWMEVGVYKKLLHSITMVKRK